MPAYLPPRSSLLMWRPWCLSHVLSLHRLLAAYRSRVAAEGEYDEQELPAEVVDELEGAAGPARRAFAVRRGTHVL
jgi:hypothetical protein